VKVFVVHTIQNYWEIHIYDQDNLVEVIPTSVMFARLLIEQAGKKFPDFAGNFKIRVG